MADPLKPNDPNRRNDQGGDDKKRSPLGFFSIVLWAVLLVFLLQMCRSTVENAAVQTVDFSDFKAWLEQGYVEDVRLDSNVYTFTLKESAPPLQELLDKMEDAYGAGALGNLFSQFDRQDLESAASSSIRFQTGPIREDLADWLSENGVEHYGTDPVTEEQYMISAVVS